MGLLNLFFFFGSIFIGTSIDETSYKVMWREREKREGTPLIAILLLLL